MQTIWSLEGIFNHCRNPLYVGNILMLVGIGIRRIHCFFVALIIPIFLFIFTSDRHSGREFSCGVKFAKSLTLTANALIVGFLSLRV